VTSRNRPPREQVLIITGTSQGIGLGVACQLIEDGYNIALFDIAPVRDRQIAEYVRSRPYQVACWQVDVGNREDVVKAVAGVIDRWGRIDGLINIAGAKLYRSYEEITPEEFENVIRTNLNGPYYLCHEVIPHMKRQKYGKIINMSSRSGMEFYAKGTAYCASKAGLIGFSQSLACALRNTEITVNVLCPSGVATSKLSEEQPDVEVRKLLSTGEIVKVIRVILRPQNTITGMVWPFYSLKAMIKAILTHGVQFARWIPQIRRLL
jgi:NAD(P)-dependent dehydrogenase (short-subunit alcohol dehydrogenase family)